MYRTTYRTAYKTTARTMGRHKEYGQTTWKKVNTTHDEKKDNVCDKKDDSAQDTGYDREREQQNGLYSAYDE